MKLPLLISATFALGLFAFQPAVHAEECTFNKAQDEFEQADVERLYDCVKDSLAEGIALFRLTKSDVPRLSLAEYQELWH